MSDGTDTFTYVYNQFDQLISIDKNESVYASYTYDDRGNQISETQAYMKVAGTPYDRVTQYTYNLQNQMTRAEISTPDYRGGTVVNDTVVETNRYNASGQRIRKVEDNEMTNYYYAGTALLFSANANNWLLTENILDPTGTIVASARFDDTNPSAVEGYYFYHYDMRGSTTAIVGANGNLQKGYEYDMFGSAQESGNVSFLNEVTFTGSITDTSTGLQYMNARFYNPVTGRFISQDSYSGDPYDPWTQHLYSYCGNNPINMIDPTGHSMEDLKNELDDLKYQQKYRITLLSNYARSKKNYEKGSEMYNLLASRCNANRKIVRELGQQIAAKEQIYNVFMNIQNYIDNGDYKLIRQNDDAYSLISLFGHGNLKDNGCGYFTAIIAASIMGADIDVHDAYLYFDKPENEFFHTGAIQPFAVNDYMIDQGFYPESSDFNMIPNGTYITYYNWKKDGETGWHYQCFKTNEKGLITCYNDFFIDENGNDAFEYETYRQNNNISRVIGLAYYTNN